MSRASYPGTLAEVPPAARDVGGLGSNRHVGLTVEVPARAPAWPV